MDGQLGVKIDFQKPGIKRSHAFIIIYYYTKY